MSAIRPELVVLIIGTAAATQLSRQLPFFLPWLDSVSPFFRRFLRVMPAAALGALLLPGLLIEFSTAPVAGIAAVAAAALVAWRWGGLIIPVLVSISIAYVGIQFF